MRVLIFAFFVIVSQTAKFNTSKNLSREETVMNVFGSAKFNTSQVHKTSKPQTNVPVKIRHVKVTKAITSTFVYEYIGDLRIQGLSSILLATNFKEK